MKQVNVETMNMKELTDYIIGTFHVPLRKDLYELTYLFNKLELKHEDNQTIQYLIDFFSKFKIGLYKHMELEEENYFPEAVICEELLKNDIKYDGRRIEMIEGLISEKMMNDHSEFAIFLRAITDELNISTLANEKNEEIEQIKTIFKRVNEDMIIHTKIENENLYNQGLELRKKLIKRLHLDGKIID